MSDLSTTRTISMAGPRWTAALVAERLSEAADVLDRLPAPGTHTYYSLWPLPLGNSAGDRSRPRPTAPSPEAIDRLDEVLRWLWWLEPEERVLVWLRAECLPWKRITHRLGIGRTTAWQRWTIALLKISTRLNAVTEQARSNIKPLNRWSDSVIERG